MIGLVLSALSGLDLVHGVNRPLMPVAQGKLVGSAGPRDGKAQIAW
jgi:hypothetical protein